jgi:hypothetical protein
MKKILTSLALIACAVTMMAQQPVITFEKTEHDFGKINEADGRVSTIFTFKNEGNMPLVLSNVRASCGCTTPKWTREPVEPGQSGEITVTYNPNGRPGRFQKTITVTSNATEATKKLFIKGEVIPKPAKPVDNYPVKMGELSLKGKSMQFGQTKLGADAISREIEYANKTDHEITVDLALPNKDLYIDGQVTLKTLKPNETGKILVVLSTKDHAIYGPVHSAVYVVVNGKSVISDEYRIDINGEVIEDFGKMSVEDLQQAPICMLSEKADFGVIAAGKVVKKTLNIQNLGSNPLIIRRVYSASDDVKVVAPTAAIKDGKKAAIKVEIKALKEGKPLEPGEYKRDIQVITNDPKAPRRIVTIHFVVK